MRPAADQELVEFGGTVFVHAAAGMAVLEILPIQRELFVGALGSDHAHHQVLVARQATALAAIGLERIHRDAHRHAGAATFAVRAGRTRSPERRNPHAKACG
ncbi:hypothetical protein XPU_1197 [Xanthomonas arboricola pv. pruni str. MAFF 311562]|uniref:Uncharacterized protein n=1 Tax=Xanthomonas arboricola pv. pruni str. MAFF 311562 TaxID=1414836 RepID=W4RZ60_9XANT|nr:hypothetical protein XPU_1197 [Xanthomonas arboricola pv. pruni str. MAFF 311562]